MCYLALPYTIGFQCAVAVRAASVCGSAVVGEAVCGSVRPCGSSLWQCDSRLRQCVRQCGTVRHSMRQCGSAWQCVALPMAVCASAAVCDSARGSVWQCASVQQCMCGSAAVCGSASGSLWQCERHCVTVRAAVCGIARGSSARQNGSVRQCVRQ
jgi:hypothetical protein